MTSCILDYLPDEVLEIVLFFLDVHSITNLSSTCKLFHKLTNNEKLWKSLFDETFPDFETSEQDTLEQPRLFENTTQSNKSISNLEKRLKSFTSLIL